MTDIHIDELPYDEEPTQKKRKIRKGTTSCWECKRRKARCQFPSPSHEVCIGCERRGTACVTQEFDDAAADQRPPAKHKQTEERLRRAEGLLEKMMEAASRLTSREESQHSEHRRTKSADEGETLRPAQMVSPSTSTPSTTSGPRGSMPAGSVQDDPDGKPAFGNILLDEGSPMSEDAEPSPLPGCEERHRELCAKLHATLPSQRDADLIVSAGYMAAFLQYYTLPYGDLVRGNMRPPSALSALPSPDSHPVFLARTLLYLANGLQNLHRTHTNYKQLSRGFTLATAMKSYVEAATLVTSDDDLVSCREGLECVMLETIYYINAGDMRRAWLILRRAIGHAQLMGLHCNRPDMKVLDPSVRVHYPTMYQRIATQDRYLSFGLGLPSTTAVKTVPEFVPLAQGEDPSEYLERLHSTVIGCISARNDEDDMDGQYPTTRKIDQALQRSAQSVPAKWWLLPNPQGRPNCEYKDYENVEDVVRVLVQFIYFNMLTLLHLPYMLQQSAPAAAGAYDYSKAACVSASREMLNRYIRFRWMNQVHAAFCCREIDFSAFVACITLLLAHLERWRGRSETDFLGHQRLSDRAMVQETVTLMLEVDESNGHGSLQETAGILKALSEIEADAANAAANPAEATPESEESSRRCLRLNIPYFRNVSITRNGISSNKAPEVASDNAPVVSSHSQGMGIESHMPPVLGHQLPHAPYMDVNAWDQSPYHQSSYNQFAPQATGHMNLGVQAGDWALHEDDGPSFDQLWAGLEGASERPPAQPRIVMDEGAPYSSILSL